MASTPTPAPTRLEPLAKKLGGSYFGHRQGWLLWKFPSANCAGEFAQRTQNGKRHDVHVPQPDPPRIRRGYYVHTRTRPEPEEPED